MNKKFVLNISASILMLMFFHIGAIAQNIGINTTGAAAAASAMLDVSSANKGVLIPRVNLLSTLDVATIPSPATGLMVFNSTAAGTGTTAIGIGFYFWNGSIWSSIASSGKNEQYILTSTTLTTSSATVFKIFPGLTETLNLNVGDRVVITGEGSIIASGFNYSYNQVSLGITSAPAGGPPAGSFLLGLTAGGAAGLGKGATCAPNDDFSGSNFMQLMPFSIIGSYDVGTTGSYTFDLYIRTIGGTGLCSFGGNSSSVSFTTLIYTVIRQ